MGVCFFYGIHLQSTFAIDSFALPPEEPKQPEVAPLQAVPVTPLAPEQKVRKKRTKEVTLAPTAPAVVEEKKELTPSSVLSEETREPAAKGDDSIRVDKVEGKTIYVAGKSADFGLLEPIKTKLEGLSLIGTLKSDLLPNLKKGDHPKGVDLPFFLLSASECTNCSNKFVFLFRADGRESRKLVFPGRIRDYRNNQLVFEARAFYGKCLSGSSDVYVIFQNEKIKRRRFLQPSVYVFQPLNGRMEEKMVVSGRPGIHQVLAKVRNKSCFEIQGFDRKSERFDLKQLPFERPELSSRYQKK